MTEVLLRYDQDPVQALDQLCTSLNLKISATLDDDEQANGLWLYLYRNHPESLLQVLPEVEFLAAIEIAGEAGKNSASRDPRTWFKFIGGVFEINGLPYRVAIESFRFDWVGDDFTHSQVIEPTLSALCDPRLHGSADEFREALHKRASGGNKDLEDAIDEAAKAVESTLRSLHGAHQVALPKRQQLRSLFDSLVRAQVLPGYLDHLVAATAGPRNNMASHGQGESVRRIPTELADASIAAAATAITLLSHYLPAVPDAEEASAPSASADVVEEI